MNNLSLRIFSAIFLILPFLYALFFAPPAVFSSILLAILAIILATEWPKLNPCSGISGLAFTLAYIVAPFSIMIHFSLSGQNKLNMAIFCLSFIYDTGSFVFGKLFGRHKIWPAISPGKTWQGSMGGYLATSASNLAISNYPVLLTLLLTLLFCISALAGDLFESYLKRRVRLKDSGSILPGQGGLLDRFDSILFTTYFVFFFANLYAI